MLENRKPQFEDSTSIWDVISRAHICHEYHELYSWRKNCLMEKFGLSIKNLNNLWSFIKVYAVFVPNLCAENLRGENLCGEK